MTQGPFLLHLCQRGAFTGFQTIFFYLCSFVPKRKAVSDRPHHEWSKPSPTAGKPGRMPYLLSQINLSQQIRHTSLILVCPVSRFRHGLLSFFGAFFLSRISLGIFSQYASIAVYLHFRAFQLVRIRVVILVLAQR